ncbi:MAG: pre-16S rRNA-processing nuclease YqgF [Firmicutes bacterium]|nr:pre-16S rRNA-processing nuclease YqgF [Bacillota bacterium]
MEGLIVAIDPGRSKCGVAALAGTGRVVHQAVVAAPELEDHLRPLVSRAAVFVVGHRTASEAAVDVLRKLGVPDDRVRVVNEDRSSEAGRRRYWQARRRRGWRRLVPVGLQVPPEPYDDFVAVELAERYLRETRRGTGEVSADPMEN